LTWKALESLMQAALDAAECGTASGEVPIGAAIANGRGEVIATACNRLNASKDRTLHAEIAAFHAAAGKFDIGAKDLILISTLEPCVMCLGAAMEAGIDTVVYGLPAPFDGGAERITPPASPESQMPRIVGGVLAEKSRSLLRQWLKTHRDNESQAAFVRQLLGEG
jgi:tRNA(adenine34) deaminase